MVQNNGESALALLPPKMSYKEKTTNFATLGKRTVDRAKQE